MKVTVPRLATLTGLFVFSLSAIAATNENEQAPGPGIESLILPGILIFIMYKIWAAFTRTPEEKRLTKLVEDFGIRNSELICPHCQTKGLVHTKSVRLKKGVSGAKATGAVLTGGLSLLATGLSRKEDNTQAHCDNCNSTWIF